MNEKNNLFDKLKISLSNTRKKISTNIFSLIKKKNFSSEILFDNIETQLLTADISPNTTQKIINNIKKQNWSNKKNHIQSIYNLLYDEMLKIVNPVEKPLFIQNKSPFVILVVGVNGVGKTTTIGKLAFYYKNQNKSVILAAGDTRRAAAIDQLKILGNSVQSIPVIANYTTSDPAAVIFDAMKIATSKNFNILIIDTAGRLQNQSHNMKELKKIIQVIKKNDSDAPHETILVLDANLGQNSINQVQLFNKFIQITGIIMTKLDGSSKGGTLLSIANHCPIPIRYIGIGKNIEDLQQFKSRTFIEAILKKET